MRVRQAPGRRPHICVVGDLLADTDIVGRVERLAPEAPVPVLDQQDIVHRAGGAGLAATLGARFGADVTLVTALADDSPARRLRRLLDAEGIAVRSLPWQGTTVEKIRIGGEGHPMLRLDRGEGRVAADPDEAAIEALLRCITNADAVLAADYGRGVTSHPDVRRALGAAVEAGVPLVWDPHVRGHEPVRRATLVCPNGAEAVALATGANSEDGGLLRPALGSARALRRRWHAGAVAVTLGADGAVLVLGDGAPLSIPIIAPQAGSDTCGAGDAFAVAATIALAGGAVVSGAVQDAVAAATAFVAGGGVATIQLRGTMDGSARAADPGRTVRDAPSGPAPTVVATGGCFDIVHPGHVHTLCAARRLGDRLVVLLNDDASVRRLKGHDRPLQPVEDRRAVLESIAAVDEVVVFGEDTPVRALRTLRPDVFVKGGDYTATELPEAGVLAEWGGTVVTVPFLDGRSTTGLVTRARAGSNREPDPRPAPAR